MSLFKHFGEQGDEHRGNLFWSNALNGIPFRGPYAPTLNQEEIETQVNVTFDFKSDFFDMTKEVQLKKYQWVMDRIVNRWFMLHHVERHFLPAEKTVIVYLEWSQRYGELNPAARAARSQGYALPIQSDSGVSSALAGLQNSNNV